MSVSQTIWITGAQGLIGSHLVDQIPDSFRAKIESGESRALGLGREELDLSDFDAVTRMWKEAPPACVIHCAAISRVGDCNTDPERAFHINTALVGHLANLCQSDGARLVLFSTDLVFDGLKSTPYFEEDAPNPVHVYAESKARAEDMARQCENHLILRTSLNAGMNPSRRSGFVEEMKSAWAQGKVLDLFVDEIRCPIPASVTADAVWELALGTFKGTLHWVGSEALSRFEIGAAVASHFPEIKPTIRATTLSDYSGPPRCPTLHLDNSRVQKLLPFPIPKFFDWARNHPKF